MTDDRNRIGAVVIALLVAMSFVLGGASIALAQSASVSYTGDQAAPDPYFDVDNVTISTHNMTWDTPLKYESNSGDVKALNGEVNGTDDPDEPFYRNNPYSFIASDVNFTDGHEFPRKSDEIGYNSASALDASEWVNGTPAGIGSKTLSISDVTTAPNVDAVEIASGGSMASNDLLNATYENFTISSDADKRYIQFIVDVNTLDSAAGVNMSVHDSDGDYVDVSVANSSNSASSYDVAAASTGDGFVLQEQVGNLTVEGSGDGTMQEIVRIEVTIVDGDATVQFAAINVEKMGEWNFGDQRTDTDSDDALETSTVHDPRGTHHVHDLGTMGPEFDDAIINDLSYPVNMRAKNLPAGEVSQYLNSTDSYPGFSTLLGSYYRLELPDQYDLTWNGPNLIHRAEWPGERYVTFEYAEDTGSTDFHAASYSSVSAPGSEDELTMIDTSISAGQHYLFHSELKLTDANVDAIQSGAGGAAPMDESGGGGFFSSIWGGVVAVVGSILGVLGLRNMLSG